MVIMSLIKVNQMIFVMEMCWLFFEEENKLLNIIYMRFMIQCVMRFSNILWLREKSQEIS